LDAASFLLQVAAPFGAVVGLRLEQGAGAPGQPGVPAYSRASLFAWLAKNRCRSWRSPVLNGAK
jgi:hypothetical protein